MLLQEGRYENNTRLGEGGALCYQFVGLNAVTNVIGGMLAAAACIAAECIERGGFEAFKKMKETLIEEFNALGIQALYVNDLNLLNGCYVNLAYTLTNGQSVKLLEDDRVYWGNQIEIPGSDRCYGVVADDKHLLVCEYGCNGKEPQIVVYKRR